ncbi:D-hexose-6-phosphate mutarotase [Thalassotalea agarivorans]|uniref:Putative glucose-6-phosphate 1-epimerase n=1 Tax=Thalassotalea agarivorans TaxID=349064 RepID=A0A1H9ZIY1_THASX|nr:D-hexose-6-phosphate mutarotase [Thalassotalea agarivorans]SES81047.1 glucose-6-phosphate 1-epimerase [Thalassotalea agarivorans]
MTKSDVGEIVQTTLAEGFEALVVKHQHCNATISLYGGQILQWHPSEHKPVLWLSDTAIYQKNKGIRGGIPVCWPWFSGTLPNAGAHGFARTATWQLKSADINSDCVEIVLTLAGNSENPHWPHSYSLTQTIILGKELSQRIDFTVEDETSHAMVPLSNAFHTYFSVSHTDNVTVPVLDNQRYDCKVTWQDGLVNPLKNVTGFIDRIYYQQTAATIVDHKWQRKITVEPLNTQQMVLWNPGKEKVGEFNDIHPNGETEYVCLEPANAFLSEIEVNKRYSIGQTIRVTAI